MYFFQWIQYLDSKIYKSVRSRLNLCLILIFCIRICEKIGIITDYLYEQYDVF